jgi:NAD(P)H-dependent FMN reductase
MKMVAISGTNRPGNLTTQALSALVSRVEMLGHEVFVLDSQKLELSFPGHGQTPSAKDLKEQVLAADAVILATPEYHGGFSAFLKLVLENLGFPNALKGKPVALLGVAAGRIGAVKSLEQLRSVVAHTGGVVMPNSLSIAGVKQVFDDAGNPAEAIEKELGRYAGDFDAFASQWVGSGRDIADPLEEQVRSEEAIWVGRV